MRRPLPDVDDDAAIAVYGELKTPVVGLQPEPEGQAVHDVAEVEVFARFHESRGQGLQSEDVAMYPGPKVTSR